MQQAFYILGTIQVLAGLWALVQGFQWLAMVRRRLTRHPGFYAPRLALICPCKGNEPGLDTNLAALASQDYSSYEIFFVLARADDPSRNVIERAIKASKVPAHLVIAGKPDACGEKVNNLRVAVEQLGPDFDVLAFADSDARPGRQWLTHLVAPLADPRLGASTTFRWTMPDRGGFWSAFGAAWDGCIATMLGEHNHNFCWGGGVAIRRIVFDQTRIAAHWAGVVSDDWVMTRALREANRSITFVPECLVPTLRDANLSGLIEFTNRQIAITRVYARNTWALGAASHLLYCLTCLLGIAAMASAWSNSESLPPIALVLFLVTLLAAAKGVLRWQAAAELLPAWKQKMVAYAWAWTLLAPLVPFLYAINFISSAFRHRIKWRGITYELVSATRTRIL